MVTPIMLNCKGKKLRLRGLVRLGIRSISRHVLSVFLAVCALLLSSGVGSQTPSVEDLVDEIGSDSVEARTEDSVQDQVEERVQDQIEERARVVGARLIGTAIEDGIEVLVYETIYATLEDEVEDSIQDVIQGEVETEITSNIEDTIEDAIEVGINESVEITLEGNIENEIEQDVEETIESIVEESVEGSVEERIADNISDRMEETLAIAVEEELTENVEQRVEAAVEVAVETDVEIAVEQSIEMAVETDMESSIESQISNYVEDRVEDSIDDILERRIEVDEDRIQKDQWLVMAAPEAFEELATEGYLFETVSELPGLGLVLAEVAAPSSFDITTVRQGVIDIVGSNRAEVDLNHIYTAGRLSESLGEGISPRSAINFPDDTDGLTLRIGMIDSQVDVSHPSLKSAKIETKAFTPRGAELPQFHGTAIASIIAGSGLDYIGIAPNARLYAAGVFEQDPQRGEIASTVSLVRALDWLVSSGVDVVNISLAGPPNRLLESALERASSKDVTVLAAAGNGGPSASPMYPAAYASVVAVTAVDTDGQVFRLANRGDYLDIAAPGVAMRHAKSGGGYAASSGTSFAVPFATAAVARLRQLQPGEDVLAMLWTTAEDLGPPGRDSIYGFGLLRPAGS